MLLGAPPDDVNALRAENEALRAALKAHNLAWPQNSHLQDPTAKPHGSVASTHVQSQAKQPGQVSSSEGICKGVPCSDCHEPLLPDGVCDGCEADRTLVEETTFNEFKSKGHPSNCLLDLPLEVLAMIANVG
jgi:hypothetical protein